jgi:hypothetical protein
VANLDLIRWQRFAPDIGRNREMPEHERLVLEVAVGLSRTQLEKLRLGTRFVPTPAAKGETPEDTEARRSADDARVVEMWDQVLAPYVRIRGEHTIDGKPIANLRAYLSAVPPVLGLDVYRALVHFNSLGGTEELFSARLSGGLPTTDDRDLG